MTTTPTTTTYRVLWTPERLEGAEPVTVAEQVTLDQARTLWRDTVAGYCGHRNPMTMDDCTTIGKLAETVAYALHIIGRGTIHVTKDQTP